MALNPLQTFGVGLGTGVIAVLVLVVRHHRQLALIRVRMEELQTQTRNARATRDAVGQVIGSMTQRVLGPIQNIVGFGRVLEQSTTTTDSQRAIAHAISDSGKQLEQILGDALGVSLSTTGGLDLDEEEVDLRDLLASVARSVRSRCIRSHLKFSLLLGPDLPKTMVTDTVKLRYLLQNMINEVIESTDVGGGVMLSAARWVTPAAKSNEIRLSFEASGGERAPTLQPGSSKARKALLGLVAGEDERTPDQLTLVEQFARVLGGSIVAIEGAEGGVTVHAEIVTRTDEAQLADVIELEDFQTTVIEPDDEAFFGMAVTKEERLVDLVLLDRTAD